MIRTKTGAAGLSIASNSILIVLKLSLARSPDRSRSSPRRSTPGIDLLASVIAFFSVRAADEPADREHPYGHEKVENMAAAIEGMLILVGAGIIIFEATKRLIEQLGGRAPRHRHRGDRVLGAREPLRLDLPLPPRQGARLAGARGRRRAPANRRDDLRRCPARPGVGRDHRRARVRLDRRARRCGGDRLHRLQHPHRLRPRARRRGAAGRRARPDRARDRRRARPPSRDRRLPQAPRARMPERAATSTCTCSSAGARRSSWPTSSPTRCARRSRPRSRTRRS